MAEVGQRQRRRAEGREQRRARAAQPVEKHDDDGPRQTESATGVAPQLQRALMAAATAALAGGLAGAAKAVVDRRGRQTLSRDGENEHDDQPAAQDEPPERDEDAATDEHETAPPDEDGQRQQVDEENQRAGDLETAGAASDEVAEMIARARQAVEHVLGHDAEGVSGIERSNGRWCITVEVVELRRVPDSTDVLASYAVVLDDEGDLVGLERTRRYRRSQVEDGR